MTTWLAWKRDDDKKGTEVAEIWRNIIHSAQMAVERGEPSECMDWCLIITECIAGDGATREALKGAFLDFVQEDPEIQEAIRGLSSVAGVPMPSFDSGRNLFKCTDPDVIFAQSRALVDSLKEAIDDFFQIWEAGTNLNERAQLLISAIPVVSDGFGDDFLAYLDKLQEDIVESIEGHYTTTGENNYRDVLTCEIFCRANEECEININVLLGIFADRLGAAISPNTLVPAFAAYFLGGTFTGEFVCDFAFMNIIYLMCVLNPYAGVRYGLGWFDSILKMAANDPDPDWELLDECTDCAEELPICEGSYFSRDFTEGPGDFVETVPGYGTHDPGLGWGIGSYGFIIGIDRSIPGDILKIVLKLKVDEPNSIFFRNTYEGGWLAYSGLLERIGLVDGLYHWHFTPDTPISGGLSVQCYTTDTNQYIVELCCFDILEP